MKLLKPWSLSPDQVIALVLLPPTLVLLGCLYVIVVFAQGRPFIYASERMRTSEEAFRLYKIRTMHPPDPASEESVLCRTMANRVTRVGAFLRRSRLDELPQIFNVLRGDIGFIGPRPPLRKYVESFPDLYREVLDVTRPGITGLATVVLHNREERLLSRCPSPADADAVYRKRCIPVKARLDRIYRRRRGWRLNALILARTFSGLSFRPSRRRGFASSSGLDVPRVAPMGRAFAEAGRTAP